MFLTRVPPPPDFPDRWGRLATYNAERDRGIVHTPEYDEVMASWQASFDKEQRSRLTADAYEKPRRRRFR